MRKPKLVDALMNGVNVLILLMIVLLYVVTGTRIGDDAIAALNPAKTVYRGAEQGAVALECVVSWDAAAVSDMLDVLKERGAQITFFVGGQWARENAALVRRMAEEGHEVGSAGYAPLYDGDLALVKTDVELSAEVLAGITGRETDYYHSGFRERAVSAKAAGSLGMTHVSCTSDLLCGRGDGADIALRASSAMFDGSILMIHPTAAALEALPAILSVIEEAGYRVTTVGNLIE